MTQSNAPSSPGNVVPMPTNWPGPMFTPKTWPSGPSCFSELAGLNACYDSVQMMEQILAKVMTDLVTNNVAVQQAIVEAIAKSGSNVPLIGVTNGSQAQPGQVGEFVQGVFQGNAGPGSVSTTISTLVLQPGDWNLWADCQLTANANTIFGMEYVLSPVPAGLSGNGFMSAVLNSAASTAMFDTLGMPTQIVQANVSVPTLLVWVLSTFTVNGTAYSFKVSARRAR